MGLAVACGLLGGNLGALTSTAWADTVVLGDGDQLEGKVTEHGQRIRIEMDFGTVELPREQVIRIERKTGRLRQFERRWLRAETLPELLDLARWARSRGLERRSRDVYRKILALDPGHREAHLALGHVQVDGRWLTESEAKRAAGFVQVGGVWLAPDEASRRLEQLETVEAPRRPDPPPNPAAPRQATPVGCSNWDCGGVLPFAQSWAWTPWPVPWLWSAYLHRLGGRHPSWPGGPGLGAGPYPGPSGGVGAAGVGTGRGPNRTGPRRPGGPGRPGYGTGGPTPRPARRSSSGSRYAPPSIRSQPAPRPQALPRARPMPRRPGGP